jgi:hypothetical protein
MFRIGQHEVFNLNRALVQVRNTGNVSISNVDFTIVIPGTHKVSLAEVSGEGLKLLREISVEASGGEIDPYFGISIPYLNAGEEFGIELFFDGRTDNCTVHCRLEDVNVSIRKGRSLFEEALEAPIIWRGDPVSTIGGAFILGLRTAYRLMRLFK